MTSKLSGQERSTRYIRQYGIALRHYRKILKRQKRSCGICGVQANCDGLIDGTDRNLAVDHCHATGRVRGLLCGSCNTALGLFRDDPDRLRNAIDYLGRDRIDGVMLPKLPKRLQRKYADSAARKDPA